MAYRIRIWPALSVSFQTLHLAPEGMRGLEVGENDMDNPEECTVTASGDLWLQRYTNRPAELEALSMQELFTQYSWVNKQWHRRCALTDVVLCTLPRYSPDPSGNKYKEYRQTKVLLHHSFRSKK
ncbi:hypothetical protein C8F01DRAFT_1244226 [Mycena amicta]|nr:hypothetical protein C8F01DRAFT_1244226 [Mycena amicta]